MTVEHEVDTKAPELPRLADMDIKAVRALLPGKMLGRTAAVLGAALTVFSSLGALSKEVQEVLGIALEPWVLALVAIGSAVVVAIQIGVEAWTAQVRRRTQDLAVKAEVVPSGYFRIGPYSSSQEDRESFRRADRIHERVLDWLLFTEGTPLYLTGDSGSGKSSLLSAFVLPSLRARGWTIAEARAWQDPVAALRDVLGPLVAGSHRRASTTAEQSPENLRRLIAAAGRRAATRDQTERAASASETTPRFAIVLDQFEEFIVLHTPEQREGFLALLTALRERPVPSLRLLLVLRSDYQTSLDELGLPPLRQGENWMQIGRFTLSAASTFLIRSGLGLRKQALERILHSAAEMDDTPGMVRPITLNVVGYVLASGGASAPSLDAGVLVRRYIQEAAEQPAIRDYAPSVLERMITEQGTKQPRSERDLVEDTKLRPAEVRAALNGLHTAALARPLDRERAIWELSHDFIARAAARYLGRRSFRSRERLLGYVAPALLSIVLAIAAGGVAWQSGAEDRAIARLALLGLAASHREGGGLRLEESTSLNQASFEKVKPALTKLSDQIRAVRINNHNSRNGNPIEDLAPIGQLVQLRSLELANTDVHKYDVLKNLSTLEYLDLSHTPITDVSPLSGLANLKTLHLSGTPISDISPIAGLIGLEELHLEGTRIRDLAPLAQLTALRKLTLPPGVDDLRPLAGMVALQELNLAHQQGVEDLSPLAGLTRLVELHLEGTQVKSLVPLARLTSLRKLSLPSGITDIGPLASMVGLEELDLSNQQVRDLAPLRQMTALKTLNLARQKVEDLSPMGGLHSLVSLNLSATPVSDITALTGLHGLETLLLNGTKVLDLGPIAGLSDLKMLDIRNTGVSDLGPVSQLHSLHRLLFTGSAVTDLSALRTLNELESLDLTGLNVTDAGPIAALPRLQVLQLPKTKITTLPSLNGLIGLLTIDISHTAIVSIEMLSNLKSLRVVNLFDTKVRDISPLRDLPQLSSVTASPDALTDKAKEEFRTYRRSIGLNTKIELVVR